MTILEYIHKFHNKNLASNDYFVVTEESRQSNSIKKYGIEDVVSNILNEDDSFNIDISSRKNVGSQNRNCIGKDSSCYVNTNAKNSIFEEIANPFEDAKLKSTDRKIRTSQRDKPNTVADLQVLLSPKATIYKDTYNDILGQNKWDQLDVNRNLIDLNTLKKVL